jgi:TonB-linked SusC/RagA family outer membrane protein
MNPSRLRRLSPEGVPRACAKWPRWVAAVALSLALGALAVVATPSGAAAQATVTGRVTDANGAPVAGAQVRIETIGAQGTTGDDGRYTLLIPAARLTGGVVYLTIKRIGLRAQTIGVTPVPGGSITQNFTMGSDPFQLEEVVVTGQGLTTTREKIGGTISTVDARDIEQSKELDITAALAGKAPNVQITKTSGEPGAGTFIQIRGAKTLQNTEPLFVVDGQPIDNSSTNIENNVGGTQVENRAMDINPADIQSVEILKGAAATIYGSRAANGVILITTKSGQRGATHASLTSTYTFDNVTAMQPLQTQWSQGYDGAAEDPLEAGQNLSPTASVSWGPALPAGTSVYDHAFELFRQGHEFDNTMTLSGGTEQTTYYLSLGYTNDLGTFKTNSAYRRISTRLKGSHDFRSNLTVGGNFAYTESNGDLIQQGSNVSGVLLGALRTPPEFNNWPYLDPTNGLHRSYRYPNPTVLAQSRGYDNPFWVMYADTNTTNVDRMFGNINANYDPLPWLNIRYQLGADFSNDQRLTLLPKSSSEFPTGRLLRAELVTRNFDHSLLATIRRTMNDNFAWSLTLGQNLNQQEFRNYTVNGQNLIFGTTELNFTIDRTPNEFYWKVRTDGYFAHATVDLAQQLYLAGDLRYDGSNTFGGTINEATGKPNSNRFVYPGASAVWEFTHDVSLPVINFGKLRAAYGVSGRQPPVFSNVSAFQTGNFFDGWLTTGLNSIYSGYDGVFSQPTLGNTGIKPEKTAELEGGADLQLFNNKAAVGVTYYHDKTTDAILQLPVSPSTGYFTQFANGAQIRNWGWEATLDLRPVERRNFSWAINAQWAKNNSMVDTLLGAENVFLNGFTDPYAAVIKGQPYGVLYGYDFVRFGNGSIVDTDGDGVPDLNIDQAYPGAPKGTMFINVDGYPVLDEQQRAIGDPNPDWTGSLRNTVTLYGKVRISALIDVKHGGDMWNGTKGALFYFGTHAATAPMHGAGSEYVFGCGSFVMGTLETCSDPTGVAGPGAGKVDTLNWNTWTLGGIGSGFTGPSSQFIEKAGFVKLRDISLAFTLTPPWLDQFGFDALDVTVSGRNLQTWTSYTGIDPESNLTGQSNGRGMEYFNHPQVRTFALTFTLRR